MTIAGDWQDVWKRIADASGQNGEQKSPLWTRYQKAVQVLNQAEPSTGTTPKTVIWRKNKMRVYQYALPGVQVTKRTPVLMLYAMINKPYILDMESGNSFVEHLLHDGYDVYLLDWGEAGPEDKNNGFAEYVLDYLHQAVDRVCRHAAVPDLNLFAYCMGGTVGAMYAALEPKRIKNLVLLASPIDFRHAPLYNVWLSKEHFDVDKIVDTKGNIPPEMIDFGNKMLKPLSNFVNPWVYFLEKIDDEKFIHSWRLLNKWVNDGIPFPGETYRQWIRDFYQENRLVRGEMTLRSRVVDLSNISCPVLVLTADKDHIVPCQQTRSLFEYIRSTDTAELNYPVGHVSLVFGGTARKRVYPETSAWMGERD